MRNKRRAGVLLHVTSLYGKYGVGTLGKSAYEFVDWMSKSNLTIWQMLPLVPTNYGDSPYQSVSSTALNYYMIDLDILIEKKLLKNCEVNSLKYSYNCKKVDYSLLFKNKIKILRLAFSRFDREDNNFKKFLKKRKYDDFSLFMTLKQLNNYSSWNNWTEEHKTYSLELKKEIIKFENDKYLFWQWTQYEFLNQWNNLKRYCNSKKIKIMGDMPLYVAYDSVEVWKYPEMFDLNSDKSLKLVAGCPPDCFTEDGQLWGNPVYNWNYLKSTNYEFWNQRLKRSFELVDILRIDHFRGFDRFYAVEACYSNAKIGKWIDGPKFDLFKDKLNYQIVAEDLGYIDDGVKELMRQTNYPGMKIMEFAFDGDSENEHKPSNFTENFVAYTGTHDNMPMYQYIKDLDSKSLEVFKTDLKRECRLLHIKYHGDSFKSLNQTIIELGFASKANICIYPMQDLLNQDKRFRMNLPATVSTDNWSYRIVKRELSKNLSNKLKKYVLEYRRK